MVEESVKSISHFAPRAKDVPINSLQQDEFTVVNANSQSLLVYYGGSTTAADKEFIDIKIPKAKFVGKGGLVQKKYNCRLVIWKESNTAEICKFSDKSEQWSCVSP